MTREQYESLPLAELKEIAKARGMKGTSAMKKKDLIDRMLEKDKEAGAQKEREQAERGEHTERAGHAEHHGRQERPDRQERKERAEHTERSERMERTERTERQPAQTQDMSSLDSGQVVTGILEVLGDGYGFIRSDNYLPGENDICSNPAMIRRYNLKTGDSLCGNVKVKPQT